MSAGYDTSDYLPGLHSLTIEFKEIDAFIICMLISGKNVIIKRMQENKCN